MECLKRAAEGRGLAKAVVGLVGLGLFPSHRSAKPGGRRANINSRGKYAQVLKRFEPAGWWV